MGRECLACGAVILSRVKRFMFEKDLAVREAE